MQKSSGEELLKSTSIVHAFIAEKLMIYKNSPLTTYAQNVGAEKMWQQMLYRRVGDAIRKKVVKLERLDEVDIRCHR